jgi:hypothetical protein
MSSAIDVFTKFVNSPGGVLTAGAVLAGLVWKFFERVEAVLTEQTKFEIAVWLVGAEIGKKVTPWLQVFAFVFTSGRRQKESTQTYFVCTPCEARTVRLSVTRRTSGSVTRSGQVRATAATAISAATAAAHIARGPATAISSR